VKIWEISPVVFGASPGSVVEDVKSDQAVIEALNHALRVMEESGFLLRAYTLRDKIAAIGRGIK
jgi:hypothetical protein